MTGRDNRLTAVLDGVLQGGALSRRDAETLLSASDPQDVDRITQAARIMRARLFADSVFLYGFVYFSTYCRNSCTFCFYRRGNKQSPRYRKTETEVKDIALGLAASGVHLVDLTMGEDPWIYERQDYGVLYRIVGGIRDATSVPLMISPGAVPDEVLRTLAAQGVDWLALYQETHNRSLYGKLRVGQSYDERVEKRNLGARLGMLVEDGILLGVGESVRDRADSIMNMRSGGSDQVRVMSFVPQPDTPLADRQTPPRRLERLCIAVMRLAMPDRLIPASLDVDGINGLRMRLEAGANVVTSIIPPRSRLAGVSQSSLDIEPGHRTVAEVRKILDDMGMKAASLSEYESWMKQRKLLKTGRSEQIQIGLSALPDTHAGDVPSHPLGLHHTYP